MPRLGRVLSLTLSLLFVLSMWAGAAPQAHTAPYPPAAGASSPAALSPEEGPPVTERGPHDRGTDRF